LLQQCKQVEIIAKFDIDNKVITPEFKNGTWIQAINSSATKDPVEYAIANNLTIEKLSPRKYKQKMQESGKQEVQLAQTSAPSPKQVAQQLGAALDNQKSDAQATTQANQPKQANRRKQDAEMRSKL
jgi:hypothetical protein